MTFRTGSSTVTEASTDDDKTPVVSREPSSAKEFQNVAKEMFSAPSVTPPARQRSIATLEPLKSNLTRPKYSWEALQQKSVDSGFFCETKTVAASAANPTATRYQSPRRTFQTFGKLKAAPSRVPPSYEETIRRRR